MASTILLQSSSGPCHRLHSISSPAASQHAMANDYSYMSFMGRFPGGVPENRSPHWDKISIILWAIDAGYDNVIWLDVDTLVVGTEPLANAIVSGKIGMCRNNNTGWYGIYDGWHYNSGAMYIGMTEASRPRMREFFRLVMALGPRKQPNGTLWQDQAAILTLSSMEEFSEVIACIDDKWNSNVLVNPVDDPIVRGWHGAQVDNAYEEMRGYATSL